MPLLAVVCLLTLASSGGSWCGGGGYISEQARLWDIENFEDARRYWPTMLHLQWSADGSHIVFVQYSQGKQENRIYVVASDRSTLKLIVEDGYDPNISPDGERVVYTVPKAHRDLPFLIETRKIDGSDRQHLTKGGEEPNYLYPAWSPDGTRIAFARDSESSEFENPGIYAMGADGSELRWLFGGRRYGHVAGPVWSPDGKSLAFTDRRATLRVIYDIEEDSSKLTRVYESPLHNRIEALNEIVGPPAWSPDGQKLAFVLKVHLEDEENEPPDVHVTTINADGSELKTIAEFSGANLSGFGFVIRSLSWSPDGTAILFTSSRNEVFVANVNGSGHQEVGKGNYAAWSPDGLRIAVLRNVGPGGNVVYTMTPNGSDVRTLVKKDSNNKPVLANALE